MEILWTHSDGETGSLFIDLIGEGIVWRALPVSGFRTGDLIFKVKGEKHSESKVKTLAPVDVEKVTSIQAFVEYACTVHRMEKAVEKLKEQKVEVTVENTGAFLKFIGSDVIAEEGDTLEKNGLTRKEVMGKVAAHAKTWWMRLCQEQPL
jgi:hypothetical protein